MLIGQRVRAMLVVLLPLAIATSTPASAAAQQVMRPPSASGPGGVSVDFSGGLGLASGALAKLTGGAGPYAAGGLAYHITRNLALRADVSGEFLDEGRVPSTQSSPGIVMPPLRLLNFGGGLEIDFPQGDRDKPPLVGMLFLGAGATNVHASSGFLPAGLVTDSISNFNQTYLSFHGGAGFGYQATRRVLVFFRAETYLVMMRDADAQVFTQVAPALGKFNRLWEHPLTLGVSLSTS